MLDTILLYSHKIKTKKGTNMSTLKNYVVAGVFTGASIAGLAIAPAVSAATTGSTSLEAILGWTISMDSVAPAQTQLTIAPAVGGTQTTRSTAVTITTNDTAGYTLSHNASTTTLVNGGNTVPSIAGATWAAPLALTNNSWGYALVGTTPGLTPGSNGFDTTYADIDSQPTSALKYAAMPTVSTAVRSTSAPASAEVTTFWYSAKLDNTKPNGTYSTTISYSVVGKP